MSERRNREMASCHEMKRGEVYVCEGCGLELQVMAECEHAGIPAEECACHVDGGECAIVCCGRPLVKKTT